jgi:hypothetical protein
LPLLGPSSEFERIQSRTLVSGIGFTPTLLGPSPALIVVSLFAAISRGTRADPVAAPLRVPVLLDPGCAGSSAAWPLTGAHRRLCLHASSALLFQGKFCTYQFRKKKGAIFAMKGVVVNADTG